MELFLIKYLQPFNLMKTIVVLIYNQIISESSKNKAIYKLLTNELWLVSNFNYKPCVYK